MLPKAIASRMPVHGFGGRGGRNRRVAVLSPYGIPLKAQMSLSVYPRIIPALVIAVGAWSAADVVENLIPANNAAMIQYFTFNAMFLCDRFNLPRIEQLCRIFFSQR